MAASYMLATRKRPFLPGNSKLELVLEERASSQAKGSTYTLFLAKEQSGGRTLGLRRWEKGNLHDSKSKQPAGVGQASGGAREVESAKCDHVTQDSIWKQSVDTEKRCLKNWETNWGFLAEFDAQGNHKEPEPLPEKSVVFSEDVPNTNSGNYGNRVTTDIGQQMAQMEYQFYSGGRRRKMGKDMICY